MREPQRYLEPRPRWRAGVWALALALLALSLGLANSAWENYMLVRSQEETSARMRRLAQPRPAPKPSRGELEVQKRWADLAKERAFDWYPIFRALEAASSDDIELLEFAPDKTARRLVLRGEARDLQALLGYVQSVSEQPVFRQVHLAQQKNKVTGALTTIEFELRAQMK